MPEQKIICTGCPMGCHVKVKCSDIGAIESFSGNQCKQGEQYVTAEFPLPLRVLTTMVFVTGSDRLLPVRTDKPVPKDKLRELMNIIAGVRIEPPVKAGQVIIPHALGTGANVIATASLSEM